MSARVASPIFARTVSWSPPAAVGRLLLAAVMLCCLAPPVATGQDTEVTASTERSEVGKEGVVTYTITVSGVSPSAVETPEPPPTTNLVLNNPTPTTRRDLSFKSGQMGREISFSWTYRPMRIGIARFRETEVVIDGETYTTSEIRVRVVPQSQAPSATAGPTGTVRAQRSQRSAPPSTLAPDDLFIRVTSSTSRVYQNEQATVEYRLFFRPGIQLRHSRLASAWDANGFWREELDVASRPVPSNNRVNGELYRTIVLKRVAVFPTRTGTLNVDPLQIETEAYSSDAARTRYGARSRYEPVTLASDPIELNVRPLPDRAPPSFSGAVGSFSLRADVASDTVRVGGAVRLNVTIRGSGNIATIQPPEIEVPGAFQVYDPKVKTDLDRGGARIRGTKTFTYILVPGDNGRYTLPPIQFAYFNPAAQSYDVLQTASLPIQVTGDAAPAALGTTGAGLPVGDIAGLMRTPSLTSGSPAPLHRRAWPYAALALPLLLAGGLLALRRSPSASSRPAIDVAQERLDEARENLHERDPAEVYAELERALLGFISERSGVSVGGFSRDRLDAFLARRGVDDEHRRGLRELLDTGDEAQYAPAPPSRDAIELAHRRARTLLQHFDDRIAPDEDTPPQ